MQPTALPHQASAGAATQNILWSQVLCIPSELGRDHDLLVLVPGSMTVVAAAIERGIKALKGADAELDDPAQEYTHEQVRDLVQSLGCTVLPFPARLAQTWD